MSINRLQKLLFSEYCDFEDMVLIESPFAQTTKEGKGIRQVYLGLTPTRLLLATDVIPPVNKTSHLYQPGIDPDLETFELIAIYPVECVNLSIFSKRKRQTIKAHFCNNSVLYFELGGFEKRNMFWNLWCEKIKFLCPNETGTSNSETSVGSSSTNSTLYLIESKEIMNPNGSKQLWCQFGTGKSISNNQEQNWTDRYLFMGQNFEELPCHYMPIISHPTLAQFIRRNIFTRNTSSLLNFAANPETSAKRKSPSLAINRFGQGIKENCSSSLLLYKKVHSSEIYTEIERSSLALITSKPVLKKQPLDILDLAECCVRTWEIYKERIPQILRPKHTRRFGFVPHPFFLHGLGPWTITFSASYSLQIKRAASTLSVRRHPTESEMRLPISKRELISTISYDSLNPKKVSNKCYALSVPTILFWTPCYWYRPRTPKESYEDIQKHLYHLRAWRERKCRRKRFYCRKPKLQRKSSFTNSDSSQSTLSYRTRVQKKDSVSVKTRKSRKCFTLVSCCGCFSTGSMESGKENYLQRLKRAVRLSVILSAWDFDSTTIAQQLTLIDKELFVRITGIELGMVLWQRTSKNAPNVTAVMAFAHRICCLVASEVLREESEKIRARLITRFINVADKCHKMSNYQSCRTVLSGLQSPAIFRLRSTWAYVRKKHATSYRMFEHLCKLYRDTRLPNYQKSFFIAIQDPPYLPFIGDVLTRLLDRLPEYKIQAFASGYCGSIHGSTHSSNAENTGTKLNIVQKHNDPVSRWIMTLKKWVSPQQNLAQCDRGDGDKKVRGKRDRPKALHEYYKPLDIYEDNRLQCLQETVEFVRTCQLAAITYSFGSNELAREFLLKARYQEERENFFNSLNLEPPSHYNSTHLFIDR